MAVDALTVTQVRLNGIDYTLRDSERDSEAGQEAVLLIHGWPDDGTLWRNQIPALVQAGYRVLCPDLPGYGQSEAPAAVERYQIQFLVQDLIMLLDRLELKRVHCVGHDYGAVLGWQLAAHSDRLQSYTAMSVGHLREFLKLSLENLQKQMQNSKQYVAAEWRYERLQGAGHWFMLEKPDWTNQCLLSWFQRHQHH